jgi:clan AA aspartic protease (TIGR02281 family)
MNFVVRCPRCLTTLSAGAQRCSACGLGFQAGGRRRGWQLAIGVAVAAAAAAWWLRGAMSTDDEPRALDDAASASPLLAEPPPTAPLDATRPPEGSPRPEESSPPSADSAALAALARTEIALELHDGAGVGLRTASAWRIGRERRDLLLPFRALNGARSIVRPATSKSAAERADEVGGIDGNDLALVGGIAPSESVAVEVAPAASVAAGADVFALREERGVAGFFPAGSIASLDESGGMAELRATAPCDQRWLADARGRLLGLARLEPDGTTRVVLLEPALARLERAHSARLEQVDAIWFERDPAARRERATWYAAGGHFGAALADYLAALDLDPHLRDEIARPATACVQLALRDARQQEKVGDLLPRLERATELLDREPLVLHAFGIALLDQGQPERALGYLRDAANMAGADQGDLVDAMRAGYLHAGEAARARRKPEEAIEVLEEGLLRFREDPQLLKSLGLAYYELGDRERARIVLEKVASLDESEQEKLEPLLAALRPPAPADTPYVEIRFSPGGGAIRSKARLDDRVDADVIIDTGATISAISEALAARLKIDLRKVARRVEIVTANGKVDAPVVTLASLDVQGAAVTNLEAVVLPLRDDGGAEGLVGLNFLEHFSLTLDARRGVLRLAGKR